MRLNDRFGNASSMSSLASGFDVDVATVVGGVGVKDGEFAIGLVAGIGGRVSMGVGVGVELVARLSAGSGIGAVPRLLSPHPKIATEIKKPAQTNTVICMP